MTMKGEVEKVTNTVGTFLNNDSNGFQKIRVKTTKVKAKKVTDVMGTFLKEGSNGLWIIRVNKCFNEILKRFQQMKLFKKY